MYRVILIASAFIVLAASGAVHGVWTDRWSDQSDLVETSKNLDLLPMSIGAWKGTNVELEQDPKSGLAGILVRRYVHSKNGKSVTVFLGCGRAGPVCTHTPEVVTPARLRIETERFQAPGSTAEFWTLASSANATPVRRTCASSGRGTPPMPGGSPTTRASASRERKRFTRCI